MSISNIVSKNHQTETRKDSVDKKSHINIPISKLQDFDIGMPLGTGKFGHVYLAKTAKEGFVCALKIMFKSQLTRHNLEHQFIREIDIMVHLDHPNILKLYTWFHDEKHVYLVLEYAWFGQMFTILQKKQRFTDIEAATYLHQLCDALSYCHKKGVIHRDIKPENLLISLDMELKLADFGWSIHTNSKTRKTMCGTLDYLPPEIVSYTEYDERIDHWMTGILLYEMLHGFPPFEREKKQETYAAIKANRIEFRRDVALEARDLIIKILKLKAVERLSFAEIQNHPWMLKNVSKAELMNMRPDQK